MVDFTVSPHACQWGSACGPLPRRVAPAAAAAGLRQAMLDGTALL